MAKTVSPEKGKSIDWYREEKIGSEWQKSAFDQLNGMIHEAYPNVKSSIKWSQPVWESAEGPMIYLRSSSKHLTLGFWRGAEFDDPTGVLEGEGDRMKHLKFKSLEEIDPELVSGFLKQAIAQNAKKGDPTKGK
jgi:hypothetical protein